MAGESEARGFWKIRPVRLGKRLSFRARDGILLFLYTFLIFYLSSLPELGPSFAARLNIPHLDKSFHAGEYGILGFLWLRSLWNAGLNTPQTPGLALFICLLYAISDEFLQQFVPSRISSPADLVADGIGAALGILLGQASGGRRLFSRESGSSTP